MHLLSGCIRFFISLLNQVQMEPLALPEFKSRLKLLIAGGNATGALDELLRALPPDSSKYNIAIQLSQQGKNQQEALLRHVISFEQAQVQQAAWTNNLLALIDLLYPDDFTSPASQPGPAGAPRPKAGSVLYAIPARMEVQREQQCVVRLSFDEAYLLDNFFKNEDSHIRALRRLDDRMEVELIDPGEQGAFNIRSISTAQQKVERDDYTEWIFFVKPLHEGQFPLFLKVSVILLEDGEKVRKEVVLQEVIDVVTQLPEKELEIGAPMRHSGFVFIPAPPGTVPGNGDAPQDPKPAAKPAPKPAGKGSTAPVPVRQWLTGAVLVAGGLLLWTKREALLPNLFNTKQPAAELMDESAIAEARLASMTIRPPFVNVNVAPSIHTVDPGQDQLITLPTGTTIFIPAGIFVWPDNRPVYEPVQIRFREFHQPAEIITSGIPMKVRSENGAKEDWFQTAGMFDIYGATADGKEVRIANGKFLTVELASRVDGPYDFWEYDSRELNWQNKQPGAKAQPATPPAQTNAGRNRSSSGMRPAVKPPAGPDDPRYKLEIKGLDLSSCPKLKGKKTVVLLYAGKLPSEAPEKNPYIFQKGMWHERQLRPTADPDVYELSLYNDTLEYVIPVNIMLEGTELAEAKADYEKRLRDERTVEMGYKTQFQQQQAAFRRKMNIQGFGVYNYDKLWKIEDAIPLVATFEFGDLPREMYKDIVVCLITDQQRTVVSLPFYDWSKFRFSPSADNCLVAILPGDKVAVFSQADFNAQMLQLKAASGNPYTFHMRVFENAVGSVPDLQQIIDSATIL